MKVQRIAVLTLYYPPEMFGNAPLVRSAVEALAQTGLETHVVTAEPHHRVDPNSREQATKGIRVDRVTALEPVHGTLSQLKNWYRFARAAAEWLESQEPMPVISITPPFFFPKVLQRAVRARGHFLIHWLQDMYPAAIEIGHNSPRPVSRAVHWIVKRSLAVPNKVIAVTEDWLPELANGFSVPSCKLQVCENWCGAILDGIADPGAQHPPRLLFAGNIGRMADLDTVLRALSHLVDEAWTLEVCGTGACLEQVRELAKPLGDRVRFHGAVPESELAKHYASASLGIVPLRKGASRASVPSKTYSYFACGLPVLCLVDSGSHFDRLIRREPVGWVAQAGDVASTTDALRKALTTPPETLRAMGAKARALYEDRYSPEAGSARFVRTLREILSEAGFECPEARAQG